MLVVIQILFVLIKHSPYSKCTKINNSDKYSWMGPWSRESSLQINYTFFIESCRYCHSFQHVNFCMMFDFDFPKSGLPICRLRTQPKSTSGIVHYPFYPNNYTRDQFDFIHDEVVYLLELLNYVSSGNTLNRDFVANATQKKLIQMKESVMEKDVCNYFFPIYI